MAVFFAAQLDFIFFFYGLAFVLLGWVSLALARGAEQRMPWLFMAAFGFLHGMLEWLDLLALVIGDSVSFTVVRLATMMISFLALAEFARLDAVYLGYKAPGRWIYLPLAIFMAVGAFHAGLLSANAFGRYGIGFPAALATGLVLALHARTAASANRRWKMSAAIGFALYACASGLIAPETDFLPFDMVDYAVFSDVTHTPIQLVRALLACLIAFSLWGAWSQRQVDSVASPRYSAFMQRQFLRTLFVMTSILVVGWCLTEYLGGVYRSHVETAALGDLDLIASRLAGETAPVENAAKAAAETPEVRDLLSAGGDNARAISVLNRDVAVSDASDGFLLDLSGHVVAGAAKGNAARNRNNANAPYFVAALVGQAGFHFTVDPGSQTRNYYASFPVRAEGGSIVGAAVMVKNIDTVEGSLRHFERSFFIVDGDGVVVMTNRPSMMYRMMWPQPEAIRQALARDYGNLNTRPLLKEEVFNPAWVVVDNTRDYVQRRALLHGDWSLVTLNSPQGIFASRVLGIIVTLQMAILAVFYLVGRERSLYDNVQLEKRLQLEELARHLDFRAATDPLTGIYNRRKFNRVLAGEILRAQRYAMPLSLILFDVDHFKHVNDTYGHQAGDRVLVEIAHFVSAHIRTSDVLARWGGEEFMVLTPGLQIKEAVALAEKLRGGIRSLAYDNMPSVTCSFGITEYRKDDTAEFLIARADEMLYAAKIGGRDRVAFVAEMTVAPTIVAL